MKKEPQKVAVLETIGLSTSREKPERKYRQPLSQKLPHGKEEPPGDRGACEEETSSQGSE
jgi:hypothetical protein